MFVLLEMKMLIFALFCVFAVSVAVPALAVKSDAQVQPIPHLPRRANKNPFRHIPEFLHIFNQDFLSNETNQNSDNVGESADVHQKETEVSGNNEENKVPHSPPQSTETVEKMWISLARLSNHVEELSKHAENIVNVLDRSFKSLTSHLDTLSSFTIDAIKVVSTKICDVGQLEQEKQVREFNQRLQLVEEKLKLSQLTPIYASREGYPVSCAAIQRQGTNSSGVYVIYPLSFLVTGPVKAYCDLETDGGGWTVFQKRGNNGHSPLYFLRGWDSYRDGFGHSESDYWLGNNYIYALTNQDDVMLRFDLWDWENEHRYASVDSFRLTDPKKFTLYRGQYYGNAGDSIPATGNHFTTIDRDQDTYSSNCAELYSGAWWYSKCHSSNLNGYYNNTEYAKGVVWRTWHEYYYSLKKTEMKLRPRNFNQK